MRMISQELQLEPKIQVESRIREVRRIMPKPKTKAALKAYEIAKATPDVNETKVARLKLAIQNGTYAVDEEKIAAQMIKEHILLLGS